MAGRKPYAAVQAFREPIQEAVHAVLGACAYVSAPRANPDQANVLFLNDGAPLPLVDASGQLTLDILQHYKVVRADGERGPWKVVTGGWWYHIADGDGDVVGFHWHPWDVPFPHVHFYAAKRLGRADLAAMHFPTGRISIEQVLRLLVREFDVNPASADYEKVLARTEAAFVKYRTWGTVA